MAAVAVNSAEDVLLHSSPGFQFLAEAEGAYAMVMACVLCVCDTYL